MKPIGPRFGRITWLLAFYALAYGVIMLATGPRPLSQLYSLSPYHRDQAEALLRGRLSLSDSVEGLRPGLAWHDGKVQQVWGLGVGLWLLPFQALWRLFGGRFFPDRLALGVAFALLAFYSGSTGMRMIRTGQKTLGLGLMWVITLCPAVWTLARTPLLIFEETVLYAILLSLGILVSLVRIALFGSSRDFFLCCGMSAFAVWVRPTHGIYGLTAVLAGSLTFWLRNRAVKAVILGNAAWWLSAALLLWSNYARFGAPFEFGHPLTVSTPSMVYLTRFGNPFRAASLSDAAKELFGLLFLNGNVRGAWAFAHGLFPGQAPFTRWRRLDLSSFDLSYVLLIVVSLAGAMYRFVRHRWEQQNFISQRPHADTCGLPHTIAAVEREPRQLIVALLLWSGISIVTLSAFYLYYPVIASRYLLDFAPAMMGFALLTCVLASSWRRENILSSFLGCWLVLEIATAKVPVVRQDLAKFLRPRSPMPMARGVALERFGGMYAASQRLADTGIPDNRSGWDPKSGIAADIVTLVIDKPEYVELQVSERRGLNGELARKDTYSTEINGTRLMLRKIQNEDDRLKVTFYIPQKIRAQRQNQVLFLAFSAGYGREARASERFLYSVRWR